MSEHEDSPDAASDALLEGALQDNAMRAESEWLLAHDADPDAPAPYSGIANDYAYLEDLLATLPTDGPNDRWRDRVLNAAASSVSRPRSRLRGTAARWVTGGAFVAAAAVVAWTLIPRDPAAELEVAMWRDPGARPRDSSKAIVGDHLVVRARPNEPGDLRVYRSDGKLVARCPDGPGCRPPTHGEYTIEVTFDTPARYHVFLVIGIVDAPLGGTMDAFLEAVAAAKAHVVLHPAIDVR
jgi:hypothetical protein